MTDAERALADDPEGFARLRAVLHGAVGPAPGRRLPTLEERFGVAAAPKPAATRRPAGPAGGRKAACPSHGTLYLFAEPHFLAPSRQPPRRKML